MRRSPTDRDLELLAALERFGPLTPGQLFTLSTTFHKPFGSERRVLEVLQELRCDAKPDRGWVRQRWYAVASRGGSPSYYALTTKGYRELFGPKAAPHPAAASRPWRMGITCIPAVWPT